MSREPHLATEIGARCRQQRVRLTLHRDEVRCDDCLALMEQDERQLPLFTEEKAPRRFNAAEPTARGRGRT